ncbi:hypothetical protein IGI04_024756 [Brassica rapa subsp. trilocularis]|uniref:Uncharacterized protein n=1 Tax=Brassica rapa subsp. trilocularis TaxID=1813537 RepID=A0ABQ7M7L0_BRACM|nr:hypothetical protein IGI04_024756 [Brassica rapa subsp. trilocularis]
MGEKWLISRVKYLPSVEDYLRADRTLSDETVSLKVIKTLNETVVVVLEHLKDAKEHGKKRGDDLLASVRVVGSYLAETPDACKDQNEGCELLAASRGYVAVVECLVKLTQSDGQNGEEDSGSIFLACDTVLNILLKRKQIGFSPELSTFSSLRKALEYWADGSEDLWVVMMAASICSLICDFTSEEALLKQPSFNGSSLDSLARLIARSLSSSGQDRIRASGGARIFLDWS